MKTLEQQIEELEVEIKGWHESYDNHPDGFGAVAIRDLDESLNIIKQLQEENKELRKGLITITNMVDNQNPTHEAIWRIADFILNK
jgi:hypothetical protein